MQKLTIIVCLCLMCLTLKAAKANPDPMTFIQSDGTEITVRLYGDEHFSWYATMDGILLVRTGDDFFIADVDEDGCLKATKCRAHDAGQRTAQERNMMKAQRRDIFFSEKADRRRAAVRRVPVGTTDPPYFPHVGSPTAIVILVNFADTTFTVSDPVKSFDQYLNGDKQQNLGHYEDNNYGSVRRYFEDMSFGQFSPQFKVFGPVTVSKGMAYYGKNGGDIDVCYREMLTEAVDSVEKYCLIDFDDPIYDSDNDGNIDLVYFIYAGFGESNGAPTETLWPKSGRLNGGNIITLDNGKKIRRFGISNELYGRSYKSLKDGDKFVKCIDGIGLFCHEFSHTLGLPDFYPDKWHLEARTVSNQEMEMWSLMDGGEYLGGGYRPAAYTAWEREAMGWFEVETLSESQHIDIMPIDHGGKAYRIVNPADENEYMMVENIQKKDWSQKALGHGLLVYHVYWPAKTVNLGDYPNNTKDYPRMAVVPADSLLFSFYLIGTQEPWGTKIIYQKDEDGNYVLDENGKKIVLSDHVVQTSDYNAHHAGDPFPGNNKVTELSWNLQLPNFVWYTPVKSEDAMNEKYIAIEKYPVYQTLRDITEDTNTGVVSFDFYTDYTTGIDMTSLIKDEERIISNSTTVYDLQGRKVSSPSGGGREGASSLISHPSSKKGIYIIGGKKIVVR